MAGMLVLPGERPADGARSACPTDLIWHNAWRLRESRAERPASQAAGLPAGGGGRETGRMEKFSLEALAREQARRAAAASSGRSAETVYGGHEHALRQTVLALTAGSSLDEHENPGEATVQVLRGRVRLTAGDTAWERPAW